MTEWAFRVGSPRDNVRYRHRRSRQIAMKALGPLASSTCDRYSQYSPKAHRIAGERPELVGIATHSIRRKPSARSRSLHDISSLAPLTRIEVVQATTRSPRARLALSVHQVTAQHRNRRPHTSPADSFARCARSVIPRTTPPRGLTGSRVALLLARSSRRSLRSRLAPFGTLASARQP